MIPPCKAAMVSQAEFRQCQVVVRTASQRPTVFAVFILDRQVVDAGDAPLHEALRIEFPVLVAIGAEPVTEVVMPFVGKTDGNAVALKCPQLLDEPVIQLLAPLAGEERND